MLQVLSSRHDVYVDLISSNRNRIWTKTRDVVEDGQQTRNSMVFDCETRCSSEGVEVILISSRATEWLVLF